MPSTPRPSRHDFQSKQGGRGTHHPSPPEDDLLPVDRFIGIGIELGTMLFVDGEQ